MLYYNLFFSIFIYKIEKRRNNEIDNYNEMNKKN